MVDRLLSLLPLFGEDVSVRWLITVLHFLWQGAVIGVVVAIAARFLRAASAPSRYRLYSAALVSLPVCMAITFCVIDVPAGLQSPAQMQRPAELPAKSSAAPAQIAVFNSAAPSEATPATAAAPQGERDVSHATSPVAVDDNSRSTSQPSLTLLSRAAPWVAVAYIVGVVCFLLRLSAALWGSHRLRSPAARVTDATLLQVIIAQADHLKLQWAPVVAYCEQVAVPTVVGVLRPMVLLPASIVTGLSADDFAAIIRHELAHIRRYDLWMNLLQRVIESLLFFHPVVWYVSRQLSAEREVCCDELVVSSGCEPLHYAGALLRMAEVCAVSRRTGRLTLAATGDRTSLLERRIERLMNWSHSPRLQLTRAGVASLWLILAALLVAPWIAHAWAHAPAHGGAAESGFQEPSMDTENKEGGPQRLQKPAFQLPDHWSVVAVGFDHASTELVTASAQNFATIRRWDVGERKLKSEIKLVSDKHGRSFRQETLTLSGDCRRVIAATDDYVGIWETSTGKLVKMLPFPKKQWEYDCVRFLACTPDLSVIVGSLGTTYSRTTLVYDAHTIVWDGATGKALQTLTHKNATQIIAIALSPDGKRLATTNGSGATIWDTTSGEQLLALPNDNTGRKHSDPEVTNQYLNHVWSLQFSPSGKQLAIGDTLGVKLLDAETGNLLHQLEAPYRYSNGSSPLVFSKNGQLLARLGTGTKTEKIVPIWSTQTGKQLFELQTDSDGGSFSDDGQRLAIGFSDPRMGLAVWQLSGAAAAVDQGRQPEPESRQDKVEENGHYRGKRAAEFIDTMKPTWGEARLGVELGVALTRPQRQFPIGSRVPLAVFFRNVSDKPLQIDMRPDFLLNLPQVHNAQGTALDLENVPLLGTIPHYREKLAPGEALGPFYLGFGLGENPSPGKQNWHPYCKAPAAGVYKLTQAVSINVSGVEDGDTSSSDQITSGQVEFEIVDRDQPATQGQVDKPPAATSANQTTSLAETVRAFNAENKRLGRGLDQTALSEDEVIAVIQRGEWKRDARDLNDQEVAEFEAIAASKRLPKGSYLQVYTEQPEDTFIVNHFWQVRLMAPAVGHDGFVGLTLRDTKIFQEKIDPKSIAWGKPDADGLSLGVYLSPKKGKYALGERVQLRLHVRNEGQVAVETTWANTSHPMPEDFTVTDENGAPVAVRKGQDGNWELPWISGYRSGGLRPGESHAFNVPFEISIGGDGLNKLVGRVIEARPGQTLRLTVSASNGNNRAQVAGDPTPESGNLSFTVVKADDSQ